MTTIHFDKPKERIGHNSLVRENEVGQGKTCESSAAATISIVVE